MSVHYDVSAIRDVVKGFTVEKRFSHVLGVEKEACELGKIFLPEKCEKLQIAGILHDITKNFSYEKQIELCNEYGIELDKYIAPKLLHARTGCEFARRYFGNQIVDDEIYSAIYYHTTGKAQMSLFEAIIYLADYIEENRTFADCVELRKYFYDNIGKVHSYEDKLEVLRSTLVLSFDMTIRNLLDEGKVVDFYTMSARNYLIINEKNLKWRK